MTPAYIAALRATGTIPEDILCAQDYELAARRYMSEAAYAYVAGGSGRDSTALANSAAYAQWAIYPRVLRDVTAGHTRISLAGQTLAHPILLAPVAFQTLAHAAGELETARAANATDTCMVCSTLASTLLEDVARAAGPHKWFQLYFQADRAATLALLARAEAAGYQAIVVTVDAAIQAASLSALRAGFRMPPECVAVNLRAGASGQPGEIGASDSRIFQGAMRGAPTWADIAWLQSQTALPVWVKGVMHADDARALRDAGVAGIVASNHGGRGLDGAPATLAVLPAIRAAVGDHFPLLLDGGIRSGADIFKALALGADAVLVGRLQMYALSVAGALGVAHMIKLLREELEVCMALAGCGTIGEIDDRALFRCA
ncbi:MAG TPA: alpha-hydroxy acid oxidase [Burkholderiaceae bacterium]